MKTIEIVTHCWAGHYKHYADALTYQLSSLILHPPKDCNVVATVCNNPNDRSTFRVIDWFVENTDLSLFDIPFSLPELFRRAIGRNVAAKTTKADIVWFTDVDVCFGDGCLDALANYDWPEDVSIVYPPDTYISKDHATGDRTLARTLGEPCRISLHLSEYVPKRYNSPIGPVQIVKGDFAREHGYLGEHIKWQKSVTDGKFARCSADPVFRKFCKQHGKVGKINLPNVYRIRHTEASSSGHTVP